MQRIVVDAKGRARISLERGRWKAQSDEHVILLAGADGELEILRRIFREFAVDRRTAPEIATRLNHEGVAFIGRWKWSREIVLRLLKHELMMGTYVYNRRSGP